MAIEFFVADKIDFTVNERNQFERIRAQLMKALSTGKERYCFIVDYIIGNQQYDMIVIKKSAVISVDLKGYRGIVTGSENGPWKVETPAGATIEIDQQKNPFIQAREQRYKLIGFVNDKLKKITNRFSDTSVYNISSIVCFEEGSTYDIDQIDYRKSPWFSVTYESDLIKKTMEMDSHEFILKDSEIDALLNEMKLHKIEPTKTSKEQRTGAREILAEDLEAISLLMADKFGKGAFSFEDVVTLVGADNSVRYLETATKEGIVARDGTGSRYNLSENWKSKMPAEDEIEAAEVRSDIEKFSKKDFWLMPDQSTELREYQGVYRGARYHMNFKGEVWWQPNKRVPKIRVALTDRAVADKILTIKPMGGSFRVTESGEVLTKVPAEGNGYSTVFVCNLGTDLELEGLTWKPKGLKKGHLWPSLYDGTVMSVNSNRQLLIHVGDQKAYAIDGHQELVKKVLEFARKTGGGRFKINENGIILLLLYEAPYPEEIKRQMELLTDREKNLIDVRKKTEKDARVPVYIGTFRGNVKFGRLLNIDSEWTKEDDEEFLKRLGVGKDA